MARRSSWKAAEAEGGVRIEITICDHCETVLRGGSVETYRVADGPWRHICESCQKKPFRHVEPSAKAQAIGEVLQLAIRN